MRFVNCYLAALAVALACVTGVSVENAQLEAQNVPQVENQLDLKPKAVPTEFFDFATASPSKAPSKPTRRPNTRTYRPSNPKPTRKPIKPRPLRASRAPTSSPSDSPTTSPTLPLDRQGPLITNATTLEPTTEPTQVPYSIPKHGGIYVRLPISIIFPKTVEPTAE